MSDTAVTASPGAGQFVTVPGTTTTMTTTTTSSHSDALNAIAVFVFWAFLAMTVVFVVVCLYITRVSRRRIAAVVPGQATTAGKMDAFSRVSQVFKGTKSGNNDSNKVLDEESSIDCGSTVRLVPLPVGLSSSCMSPTTRLTQERRHMWIQSGCNLEPLPACSYRTLSVIMAGQFVET